MPAGRETLRKEILQAMGGLCTGGQLDHVPCTACLDVQVLLNDYFAIGGDCHDILPRLRQRAIAGIGPEGKTAADCILNGDCGRFLADGYSQKRPYRG